MNAAPSSTYFSAPPDWGWLIVSYFFLGGLAGGSYFFAALIDLFDRPDDGPLARLGYYITLPCLVVSGMLLTLDLGRPLRFWHMLIESNTYRPMLKPWSPMSSGSWALLAFGAFAFVAFLGALAEAGRLAWPGLRRVRPPGLLGVVITLIGAPFAVYVAGYTGILLAVFATTAVKGTSFGIAGGLLLAMGLWMKARLEERWLRSELGGGYDAYRRRVPMLIPFGPRG